MSLAGSGGGRRSAFREPSGSPRCLIGSVAKGIKRGGHANATEPRRSLTVPSLKRGQFRGNTMLKFISATVLALLSSATLAFADQCGNTECPYRYHNLFCYDAGKVTTSNGQANFLAKICIVDQEGGEISVRGDLLVTLENDDPRAATWNTGYWNIPVDDCHVEFDSDDQIRSYNTGEIVFQLGTDSNHSKQSDHYIIAPQLSDSQSADFQDATNIRTMSCTFGKVEFFSTKD